MGECFLCAVLAGVDGEVLLRPAEAEARLKSHVHAARGNWPSRSPIL